MLSDQLAAFFFSYLISVTPRCQSDAFCAAFVSFSQPRERSRNPSRFSAAAQKIYCENDLPAKISTEHS